MSGDWVKQHRSIMEHPVWADPFLFKLFSWCIMKAAWKKMRRGGVVLEPGQFISGRHKASEEMQVSPSKWYRGIEKLSSPEFGCITVKPNKSWTLITVCNYKTYQNRTAKSEQQLDSNWTASEQQLDTRKEIKNSISTLSLKADADFELVGTWNTPELAKAMSEWGRHLRSNGKVFNQLNVEKILQVHRGYGWTPERLARGIDLSISKGVVSIYDPDQERPQPNGRTAPKNDGIETYPLHKTPGAKR